MPNLFGLSFSFLVITCQLLGVHLKYPSKAWPVQDTDTKSGQLLPFLEQLRSKDARLGDLIALILGSGSSPESGLKNVFAPRTHQGFDVFTNQSQLIVNNLETFMWPIVGSHFKSAGYLPIRAFRVEPSKIWGPVDKLRIFLSSGTTSGAEGRSKSAYSALGLELYQAGSIAAFLGVLERCVLPFSGDFLDMVSVSLIPPVDEWPDSSLAQMIAWFSEIWPTSYANSESTEHVLATLEEASEQNKPVVLFGTAFHFVNVMDQGLSFTLPKGSIIVETGGTKGRSRSVTREDLYQLLSERFGIEESRIVSEYGMCELASQAWDFVDAGTTRMLSERSFKFPWWVTPGVMTTPSQVLAKGVGALIIDDPLRVDIGQTALQTEDMACLDDDGTFRLLGRVPRAPLKGCSLKVTDIAESSGLTQITKSLEKGQMLNPEDPRLAKNAPACRKWFLDLLTDTSAIKCLQRELGDKTLALSAISDLAAGLPENDEGFVRAAIAAMNNKQIAQKWLLIAPASHSIAPIHPLAQALIIGLDLRIRLPEIAGLKSSETFLARAVELAKTAGFHVTTLPSSFRLGQDDLLDGENILIFGDDETCAMMRKFAPGRVAAFGTAVSMSIARIKDLESKTQIQSLISDQLSLAQRGCLSSRVILIIGGKEDSLHQILSEVAAGEFFSPPKSPGLEAARSIEDVRLSQAGFRVNPSGVMIATKNSTLKTLCRDLEGGISRLDFVIPVLVLPEDTSEVDAIEAALQVMPIRAISAGERSLEALLNSRNSVQFLQTLLVVELGTLGRQPFDGRHLGLPFFGVSH